MHGVFPAGRTTYPTKRAIRMNTSWAALVWKEWRETRWKMAALGLIVSGCVLLSVFSDKHHRLDGVVALCCMVAGASSIFVALGVAAGENSHKTLPFLEALPVPSCKPATVKLLIGAFASLAPAFALVASIALLQSVTPVISGAWGEPMRLRSAPSSYFENHLLAAFGLLSVVGFSLYIWTAALAVNARDEVQASVRSLGALVGWFLLCLLSFDMGERFWIARVGQYICTIGPLGFLGAASRDVNVYWAVGLCILGHLGAGAWFIRRWGHLIPNCESSNASETTSTAPHWLAPPRASIRRALVWKAYREAGPIVGAGLLGVIGLAALMTGIDYAANNAQRLAGTAEVTAQLLTYTLGFFAFLVAIICGVGTVWGDVQPGINSFWRSRPAPPGMWFWSKCLVSIAMIGVAFSLPALLIMSGLGFADGMPQMATGAATAAATAFATAVLMTTLLRSAVYACILALCAGVATMALVGSEPNWVLTYEFRAQLVAALALVMLLLAWQAFRKDWSVRG